MTWFNLTEWLPVFKDLEGEPRFQAARARMLENLNTQRAEQGLAPVST